MAIGVGNVLKMDELLLNFVFSCVDVGGRIHELKVSLQPDYPFSSPLIETVLPVPLIFNWIEGASTIKEIYDLFCEKSENFQDFFNTMDEVDSQTWVLEPKVPHYGSCRRRIVVGENVTLVVEIDPSSPFSFPSHFSFIGASHLTDPLKRRLEDNEGRDLWDEDLRSFVGNVQNVLDLTLPPKGEDVGEGGEQGLTSGFECSICYSLSPPNQTNSKMEEEEDEVRGDESEDNQLGEQGGFVYCKDERCGRSFHPSCLAQWLQALPDSHSSFGSLFGSCPYCSSQIFIPVSRKVVI